METNKVLKNSCMGCLLTFGVLTFIYFIFTLICFESNTTAIGVECQPFEVQTKKGMVKLHLGIPKDSLIMLVGEPDNISSHSLGNTIIENIGYKVKDDDFCDLTFVFENGKLERFNQH